MPPRRSAGGASPAPARRARGFTLVEVMVALVIMAVIAVLGWQGVSSMSRTREISAAATERSLRLSALIGQWEQDLQAVYDSTQLPGLSFAGSALRIVRRSDAGVQVVVWALRDGVWQRWASPTVDRAAALQQAWLASMQLQGQEHGQLRLLDGVSEWQVYFWRSQGWSNAQSSGDLVTSTTTTTTESGSEATASSSSTSTSSTSSTSTSSTSSTSSSSTSSTSSTDSSSSASTSSSTTTTTTSTRVLLPLGVRLQLALPEGRLTRDVMLRGQMP